MCYVNDKIEECKNSWKEHLENLNTERIPPNEYSISQEAKEV